MRSTSSQNLLTNALGNCKDFLSRSFNSSRVAPSQEVKISTKSKKPRIKWADDLEQIKTFRKNPSQKRVELLMYHARNTSEGCGKSILKHKDDFVDEEETEASSTFNESECSTPSRVKMYRFPKNNLPKFGLDRNSPKHRSACKSESIEDKLARRISKRYHMAMKY